MQYAEPVRMQIHFRISVSLQSYSAEVVSRPKWTTIEKIVKPKNKEEVYPRSTTWPSMWGRYLTLYSLQQFHVTVFAGRWYNLQISDDQNAEPLLCAKNDGMVSTGADFSMMLMNGQLYCLNLHIIFLLSTLLLGQKVYITLQRKFFLLKFAKLIFCWTAIVKCLFKVPVWH